MSLSEYCTPYASFFGFAGVASAMIFSSLGAAYGTAKSGIGIAGVGQFNPSLIMKSLIPVVMSGIIAVYGLVMAVLISGDLAPSENYSLYNGFVHLAAGSCVGLTGLAAGWTIGIIGDAGVRSYLEQPRIFVSMVLVLIFAEGISSTGRIDLLLIFSSAWSLWPDCWLDPEYKDHNRVLSLTCRGSDLLDCILEIEDTTQRLALQTCWTKPCRLVSTLRQLSCPSQQGGLLYCTPILVSSSSPVRSHRHDISSSTFLPHNPLDELPVEVLIHKGDSSDNQRLVQLTSARTYRRRESSSMNAKVVSISNYGDLNLEGKPRPGQPTPTRQLSLAHVVIPKINKTGDEPGAFQAREFLRRNLVGKQVTFSIAYTIPTTQREFGTIKFNGKDVLEQMLRDGLIKYREESSKRDDADKVLLESYMVAEAQARSENKGLWSQDAETIAVSQDIPDGKVFLSQYQGKKIDAIIEQVRSGDNLRARLLLEPAKHQYLNLLVAGIKAPASDKSKGDGTVEEGEEFGEEAKVFVESRLLQRFVQVSLLGSNQNATGYIATIHHPAGNIAEALLSNGLARVQDYQSTMLGDTIGKLRQAEGAAKQRRLNLWKSHVPKAAVAAGSFDAVVSRVISADTIMVRNKDNREKRLQLSSIRAPRMNEARQALFAAEAKEFVRKKVIGKHVNVVIDFRKPASEGFEERDLATITLSGRDNLAKLIVEKGYATVIRHRRDDEDRSPAWDELLAAEESAISQQKGMHSLKDPAAPGRIVEASENATRAKQYLSTLQRAKRNAGVVEFVASGGRFKILIPRENAKLTLVLSGIRVPRTARNASESSEPMGAEAAEYATRRLMQRDVEIEVETTDRVGGFIGTIYVNKENFAVGLLEEGLANVHDFSAEQSGHALLYREAEGRAKAARKGLHANYDPAAELKEVEQKVSNGAGQAIEAPQRREYIDLVVTDVNATTGSFSYQIVGDSVKSLEKLMGDLQVAYAKAGPSTAAAPKVGDTVAAKFSEDDAWYRGRVKRVDRSSSKAEILYYDYGNSELVDFKRLTTLDSKYTALPAQAKEARLSFITLPQNLEYLEDAVAYFQSICQKQLVASVDRKEGSLVYLSLYDPENQDASDSINASMVEEGWATVVSQKKMTWEKIYGTTIKALQGKQAEAQRRHKGMFEFGDSTEYED